MKLIILQAAAAYLHLTVLAQQPPKSINIPLHVRQNPAFNAYKYVTYVKIGTYDIDPPPLGFAFTTLEGGIDDTWTVAAGNQCLECSCESQCYSANTSLSRNKDVQVTRTEVRVTDTPEPYKGENMQDKFCIRSNSPTTMEDYTCLENFDFFAVNQSQSQEMALSGMKLDGYVGLMTEFDIENGKAKPQPYYILERLKKQNIIDRAIVSFNISANNSKFQSHITLGYYN